jgi:hypothetical protein
MSDIVEALGAVPVTPAPLIATYPQFCETAIPAGCEATRAYRGYIRPFSDDATARRVLRALTANKALSVASGRLDSEAIGLPHHPLEDYLLNMAEPCTVVVLEFDGKEHPRAYLVDPPLIRRLSTNAHLRWDKSLLIEGRRTPALCIYSGNLFKYDPSYERLSQFLNQLSTYLAKHLIFLRTRTLHTLQKDGTLRPRKRRKPWEPVKLGTLPATPLLGPQYSIRQLPHVRPGAHGLVVPSPSGTCAARSMLFRSSSDREFVAILTRWRHSFAL